MPTQDVIKKMLSLGVKPKQIAEKLKIGLTAVYTVKGDYKNNIYVCVRGLSEDEKDLLNVIAKNKSTNGGRNKVILSYIRQGIAAENPQNKIYLD